MNVRAVWMLKTTVVTAIIVLCNYPIAFAICHDISPHASTLLTTILIISLLYGFCALCGPHHFHALLIGLLAGNLISVLTWIVSFRDTFFHLSDPDKLSVFYSLGVFLPSAVQFYLSVKENKSETKKLHLFLTTGIILFLFGHLLHRYLHRMYHDSFSYNFLHFSLGFLVGLISASGIQLILSRHLLMFEKLYLYLEVMLKPILAFFLGYLLIMFTFTGIYTIAYFYDPSIFNHLNDDKFGDMMFYSFSTITGIGFSVIEPQKPLSFALTSTENFLGLIWITVVFAAALAHLQIPFRRISSQLDHVTRENKLDHLAKEKNSEAER